MICHCKLRHTWVYIPMWTRVTEFHTTSPIISMKCNIPFIRFMYFINIQYRPCNVTFFRSSEIAQKRCLLINVMPFKYEFNYGIGISENIFRIEYRRLFKYQFEYSRNYNDNILYSLPILIPFWKCIYILYLILDSPLPNYTGRVQVLQYK